MFAVQARAEGPPLLRGLEVRSSKDGGLFRSMEHTAINRKFQDPGHRGRRGHRVRMIHDLRRTFCTELARHDVNQKVEKELSRHKTMVTLEQYYQNVDMDAERAALRKVRKQRA